MGKKFNKQCPECKSKNVIPIAYGMPGPDMIKKSDNGEIMLGGCSITTDDDDRYCKECNNKWNKSTEFCTRCMDVVMYCDCYKSYIEDKYDS